MKSIKEKQKELMAHGFKKETIISMNEERLSKLYNLITDHPPIKKKETTNEQVKTVTKQVKTTTIPQNLAKTTGANVGDTDIKMDATGNVIATQMEAEMAEAEVGKSKKQKANPWAICTKTMGKKFGTTERSEWSKKQMKEYEACVTDVKKGGQDKNKKKLEEELEKRIVKLVEKHISPKMTKKDLVKMLSEASPSPVETPTKPDVKPDTKPNTRPSHPGKNPLPGVDPAPKAKKSEEKMKADILNIIAKILKEK